MRANKLGVMLFGVLSLCLVTVTTASAQLQITQDPSDLERTEYRVRVDSTRMQAPHTVGIFGRPNSSEMRIRFDGGRTGPDITSVRLNGGMRIVCIWTSDGYLVFFDSVYIDRGGTLRLPGVAAARGGAGAPRGGLRIQ